LNVAGAAVMKILPASVTYYISPTGSDTTGNGSSGSPWATIGKFLTTLAPYYIPSSLSATLIVKDGIYTSVAAVFLNHPNGNRITIQGEHCYSYTMDNVISNSGGSGAWYLTLHLNSVDNITVGDYVLIKDASGGTRPILVNGCHYISAVDVPGKTITVLSYNKATTYPTGSIAALVSVLKSVLNFSTEGITVSGNGYLLQLALVGPGSGKALFLPVTFPAQPSRLTFTYIGLSNWQFGLACINASAQGVLGGTFCVSKCTYGVYVEANGDASLHSQLAVIGCDYAIYTVTGSTLTLYGAEITGNTNGVYVNGGSLNRVGGVSVGYNTNYDFSPALDTVGNYNSMNANY
jgi:hypothetical protein